MAFALMGRHVKSIYFNDLLGLANDYDRMNQTGELRDIKRTKSDYNLLKKILSDPNSIHSAIAKGINNLIALVDTDPALDFRGNEAKIIPTGNPAVACIHNHCGNDNTITLINTSGKIENISIDLSSKNLALPETVRDQFSQQTFNIKYGLLTLALSPYQRLWLKEEKVEIPGEKLIQI